MCSLLVAIQVLIKLFIELLDPFLESAGASQNFVSCGSRSLITKDDTAVQTLAAQTLSSLSSRRQQQLRAHKQLSPRLRIQSQSSSAVMQHKQKGQRQEVIHAVQYSLWDTITAIPPAGPAQCWANTRDVGSISVCLLRNTPPPASCALKAASGAKEGH